MIPMRDLLLAAIVVGVLPFCFSRPWFGILVWTWIGTMNPQWLTFGFAHEFPWAMAVGVATLAGIAVTRDRKPVPWNLQLVLMVMLVGYFSLTSVLAWMPDMAWEKLKLVVKVVLMAIVGTAVIYGRSRIRWLLIVIALSIAFYGIKGGIWVLATGGSNMVHGPEGGFIQGNNAIGVALLMVVPIMLALAREEQRTWVRRLLNASIVLSCISVVFTYSRGAMLGLATSTPLMFLSSKRKFLAVLLIAPIIAAGVMFAPSKVFDRAETIGTYEKDGSAMQRLAAWSVAWNVAVEKPIAGAGFDFYQTPNGDRWLAYMDDYFRGYLRNSCAAHSIYFQILGEHGFLALALYLLLLFSTLRRCSQLKKRTAGHAELEWIGNYAGAIRIGLIGYMVTGAFLSIAYFDLAWVYCSFTAILGRELAARKADVPATGMQADRAREQMRARPIAPRRPHAVGVRARKRAPQAGL